MKTRKKKDNLLNLILAVLLLVVLGSGTALVLKWRGSHNNTAQQESMAALAYGDSADEAAGISADENGSAGVGQPSDGQKRRRSYEELKSQNEDMVGWIAIPGTGIDYPVMQTPDSPDYYLEHDFQKNESIYGVPYVAESCDLAGNCQNVIVYGHHMKDGSMFAGLMNYADEAYYKEHPVIQFDTLEENGEYRIISVFCFSAEEQEEAFYQKMQAGNRLQYSEYVAELSRRRYYDTGEIARYGEQLLTLVTCEYSQRNGRMIVVAKRVE